MLPEVTALHHVGKCVEVLIFLLGTIRRSNTYAVNRKSHKGFNYANPLGLKISGINAEDFWRSKKVAIFKGSLDPALKHGDCSSPSVQITNYIPFFIYRNRLFFLLLRRLCSSPSVNNIRDVNTIHDYSAINSNIATRHEHRTPSKND